MTRHWCVAPRPALVLALVTLLAGLVAGCSESPSSGELVARDAFVPAPPPGSPAAAYLTLENGTDRDVRIVGASSPAAERVEMHRTREVEGVMRMEPMEALELPAGGKIVLAPRATHLMLIRPRALEIGERVPLSLETADGATLRTEAIVRAPGATDPAAAALDHDGHSSHH